MTLEIKFSGVSPEQALRLIKAASDVPAEVQTEAAPAPAASVQPVIPTAQTPTVPAAPSVPPIPTAQPIPVAAPAVQPVPTTQTVPAASPAQTIPTAVRQYTQDELAVAARPLCENEALRGKLLELLHTFSYTDSAGAVKQVQSIRDLPPESYAAMANDIRQLGGKI